MDNEITDLKTTVNKEEINRELVHMSFTKNFRSATAEEWYVFLGNYEDPKTGGAAGKIIIHYDLQGNRDIFINSTLILFDPKLWKPDKHQLVYAIGDELVNRIVGYANTLLAVHAG